MEPDLEIHKECKGIGKHKTFTFCISKSLKFKWSFQENAVAKHIRKVKGREEMGLMEINSRAANLNTNH